MGKRQRYHVRIVSLNDGTRLGTGTAVRLYKLYVISGFFFVMLGKKLIVRCIEFTGRIVRDVSKCNCSVFFFVSTSCKCGNHACCCQCDAYCFADKILFLHNWCPFFFQMVFMYPPFGFSLLFTPMVFTVMNPAPVLYWPVTVQRSAQSRSEQ